MNPIYTAFVYLVWFLSTFFIVVFLLLLIIGKGKLYEKRKLSPEKRPKVSILVPAYNEEEKIASTIASLKKIDYENVEFIILNDGSKDKTSNVVKANIKNDPRFRFIDNTVNKGKAACLNQGISLSTGEYVATMDADSVVEHKVFQKVLPYFDDTKVGAVTIAVEIKKPKKYFHKLVDLEFTIGLSLFLKISSFLNTVYVTPGPFSVYRKDVLDKIGGFDPKNFTEDLEIAYRIHKAGYKIDNCMEAKVSTYVPPTLKALYVQRRRWYSGALITLFQHRKMMFKKKYGLFGYLMPFNYTLIMMGIALFLVTTYLSIKHAVTTGLYFQYTDLNLWHRLMDFKGYDFLTLSKISFIGASSLLLGMALVIVGLILARKRLAEKKWALLGWPFVYVIYQLFWIGSIWSVIRKGKKIRWR
jgi:cellulose synthase/poly-beta-1,6-N-acetylglucosamine synthase-like glycosyltransferase